MGRTSAVTPLEWFALLWSWWLQELSPAWVVCFDCVHRASWLKHVWNASPCRAGWESCESILVLQRCPWAITFDWVPLVNKYSVLWKKTIKIFPRQQFSPIIKRAFKIQIQNALSVDFFFFFFQCSTMSFLSSSTSPALPSKLLSAECYHVAVLLFSPVTGAQVTGYGINPCNLFLNLQDSHKFCKKKTTKKQRKLSAPLIPSINPATFRWQHIACSHKRTYFK